MVWRQRRTRRGREYSTRGQDGPTTRGEPPEHTTVSPFYGRGGRAAPPRPPAGPPAPPGTRAGYGRRSYGWPYRGEESPEWRDYRDMPRRRRGRGGRPGYDARRRRARPGSRHPGYGGRSMTGYDRWYGAPRGYDERYRWGRGRSGRTTRHGRSRHAMDYSIRYTMPPGRARRDRQAHGRYPPPTRRPWRFAYDAADPETGPGGGRLIDRRRHRERRSGIDRRTGEEQGPGWIQRGRELLRRFREPIIGLTVAAAAAPIAQQAAKAPTRAPTRRPAEPAPTAAPTPRDVEAAVGERWAAAEERSVRNDTIEGAMVRYGIGRGLAEDIYDTAVDEGIEPDVAFGLVNTESAFKQRAVSSVGARGFTQLMPATARWLQPGLSNEDIFDRQTNLRLGFRYLDQLVDKYDGNLRLALLAYNRGPGTVDGVLSRGGDPDNGYADMVLSG